MIKVSILSKYSSQNLRGVESWAEALKEKLKSRVDVEIYSNIFSDTLKWINGDVIVPTNGRYQVFFCRLVTWLFRKPMVVFGHSGLGADDKWNLLCFPDVFVAFSDYQMSWANRFKLPWTKLAVIPHAVDLNKFTPAKSKPNKNTILCVAANTPDKRIDLVRNAVKLIPNAKFMAVGAGNDIQAEFNNMPDIYKSADVFSFTPQPWEAFGIVFLEALASNLPVVTTNDPIRKEIVGDAGILVDHPENSQELADAIQEALKKDWGGIPRKQAEKFSWDKIAEQYFELLDDLAK